MGQPALQGNHHCLGAISDVQAAPRVGFAYQVIPRTVVRGGYGRAFDPGFFGDIFGQLVTQTIPVLQNQGLGQLDGEIYDAARNLDGTVYNIATGPSAPSNAYNIPSNGQLPLPAGIYPTSRPDKMRIPEVDGWNLTLQQQLDPTTSFSIAYVGNKSTHSSRTPPGVASIGTTTR